MATRIEERFVVAAPVEQVWAFLVDPRRVVTCLPGAELVEVVDDRTFLGNVKVKVGPVTVSYRGRVVLTEIDEARRHVRMSGEGREGGGTGSARMSMESAVVALPDGTSEVRVQADVDVAGRLVQLGRGMIEQVSRQIFNQFAERVRRVLEASASVTAPVPAPMRPTPTTLGPEVSAVGGATSGGAASPRRSPAVEPVRALPLVWRAFLAALVTWWRRLLRTRRPRAGGPPAAPHEPGPP